jgi:hypothetical protein
MTLIYLLILRISKNEKTVHEQNVWETLTYKCKNEKLILKCILEIKENIETSTENVMWNSVLIVLFFISDAEKSPKHDKKIALLAAKLAGMIVWIEKIIIAIKCFVMTI